MITCLLLTVLALAAAVPAPRVLYRAAWPARGPVTALWAWQCLVVTVLLCFLATLLLSAAAVFETVRRQVFAPAPQAVTAAYDLDTARAWATGLMLLMACGAAWTTAVLVREVVEARRRRRSDRVHLRERAPDLPGARGPLLILEEAYPDAWWMHGHPPQLVVTTGALGRLTDRQLDAVLAHEQGHARAHHDWLVHLSTALATGFPRVPLFTCFRDQTHRLVELAADDTASRRCGHLTTALALIELNQHRGVLSCACPRSLLNERVLRQLDPPGRLTRPFRRGTAAVAALGPLLALVITFAPGLTALG